MNTKIHTLCAVALLAAATAGGLAGCDRQRNGTDRSADVSQSDNGRGMENDSTRSGDTNVATNDRSATDTSSAQSSTTPSTAPGGMDAASAIENNPTGAGNAGTALSAADRQFIMDAAQAGLYEVKAGQLAASKSSDSAVKSFGAMLVKDHQDANDKLKRLADQLGVQVPDSVPAEKQRTLDDLQAANGAEFDRKFVQAVGRHDHREDIDKFERMSREAQSPAVRDFAKATLPTLRAHLSTAQKLPVKG